MLIDRTIDRILTNRIVVTRLGLICWLNDTSSHGHLFEIIVTQNMTTDMKESARHTSTRKANDIDNNQKNNSKILGSDVILSDEQLKNSSMASHGRQANKKATASKRSNAQQPKLPYKLITSYDAKKLPEGTAVEKRNAILESQSKISDTPFGNESVIANVPMSVFEESLACAVWFLIFAPMLYGPFVLLYLLVYCSTSTFLAVIGGLSVISLLPTQFHRDVCYRYIMSVMLKYFSHRGLWSEYMPTDKPSIIVGPPHGVFPFGAILACIAVPRMTGT